MEKIQDIIPSVVEKMALRKPEAHLKIQRLWQNICEKKETQHTSIVGLQKGTLVVNADSPAWLFQMNLRRKRILEKLKEEIPEVNTIRFKIGKVK